MIARHCVLRMKSSLLTSGLGSEQLHFLLFWRSLRRPSCGRESCASPSWFLRLIPRRAPSPGHSSQLLVFAAQPSGRSPSTPSTQPTPPCVTRRRGSAQPRISTHDTGFT